MSARPDVARDDVLPVGLVLVDGTIDVTTAVNTYAIDARTGAQRWVHQFQPKSMGLGTPVRGVAYADGRLFRGTPDGHLPAVGAKTGAVVWDIVGTDAAKGSTTLLRLLSGKAAVHGQLRQRRRRNRPHPCVRHADGETTLELRHRPERRPRRGPLAEGQAARRRWRIQFLRLGH